MSEEQENLEQFIYSLSHDMSAPLRAMIQFSQLLDKRLGEQLDEKERYWLSLIVDNGTHAQKMLDGLLIYSRLNTQKPIRLDFDLLDVLDIVKKNALRKFPESQIILPKEPVLIKGPREHWEIYFESVMNNALLYQPNEKEHKPLVEVVVELNEDRMRWDIHDNGIGVAESQVTKLVHPFKRFQAVEDYPGNGMGLTYCKRIIEQQNGEMFFSSSKLGGLCVSCEVVIDA